MKADTTGNACADKRAQREVTMEAEPELLYDGARVHDIFDECIGADLLPGQAFPFATTDHAESLLIRAGLVQVTQLGAFLCREDAACLSYLYSGLMALTLNGCVEVLTVFCYKTRENPALLLLSFVALHSQSIHYNPR